MKTVDIFVWRDRIENSFRMNMRRQWQLHEDAMHMFVLVELMYERQQLSFQYRRRKKMLEGFNPDIFAGFLFIAHIDVRRRVIAHQHHSQPGRHVPAPLQSLYFCLDLFLNFFGDGFAVDNSRHDYPAISAETISK